LTKSELANIKAQLDTALANLPSDEKFDRLINPRHTDHGRHVYLPNILINGVAATRRELEAAIQELSKHST
jgi:hypothetical protein